MPQAKIKIVHIVTSLRFGGAEKLLWDMARFLNQSRFEMTVITVVGGGPLEDKFRELGVKVIINEKKSRLGLGLVGRIKKQLKEIQPDIVHTHLFAGDCWGRLAAWKAGVPVIVSTAHNTDRDEGSMKKYIKWLLSFPTKKVVAVSEAVKQYVIRSEKVAAAKVAVIYNGVDVAKYLRPGAAVLSGGKPVIGVIGRLAPQKGHATLLRAVASMRHHEARLKVVGDGALEKDLKRLASTLGIEDRTEFMGARQDVDKILDQIDILVLPSLWEGLGLVLIEASLAGRVVVGSRVGGIPEVVRDKETGRLVPPGDEKALADTLDWLIDHPEAARKLAWAAQEFAKKFDIKKMVGQYEKMYIDLLKQG